MESTSCEELAQNFTSRLDEIGMLLNVRDASEDPACAEQLELLQMELKRHENLVVEVKKELAARKESLNKIRYWNEVMKEWKQKLNYMVDNMPAVPKRKTTSKDVQSIQGQGSQIQESKVQGNQVHGSHVQGSHAHGSQVEGSQYSGKQETANTYCPEMEWLTTDEFDKIPKYLKGRLSYEQVNKFIEGMNKAYSAKYKLLKLKKSSLNDAKRKRYEAFKMQETKDTIGCYFVVDEDLKEFGGLKVDNVARSLLTILRHCGRCREVRGGQLIRYCYIDSY